MVMMMMMMIMNYDLDDDDDDNFLFVTIPRHFCSVTCPEVLSTTQVRRLRWKKINSK